MRNGQRLIAAALILASALMASPALAANGDTFECSGVRDLAMRCWKMIDNISTTSSGAWVSFQGFMTGNLHVSGISSATLQIYASNAPSKPDDSTDGVQVGSDITTNSFTSFAGPYLWVKVKVSANGGATALTANLVGASGGGGQGSSASIAGSVSITSPFTAANPGYVITPATTSGNNLCSGRTILSLASSDSKANCKSTEGVVYSPSAFNLTLNMACAKLYATTGLPNVGTDAPKITFPIPPASAVGNVGAVLHNLGVDGVYFSGGIAVAITGTTTGLCSDAGSAGTNTFATGVMLNVPYK